jgi:hypothetical protein
MQRAIWVSLGTGCLVACVAVISIGAEANGDAPTIARDQYDAAMARIEAARPQILARCDDAGANRDVCRASAEADEMVRVADLDARFHRSQSTARNLQRARIEARYQVERVACMAQGGAKRDGCLIAAHATRGRALLEAASPYVARS